MRLTLVTRLAAGEALRWAAELIRADIKSKAIPVWKTDAGEEVRGAHLGIIDPVTMEVFEEFTMHEVKHIVSSSAGPNFVKIGRSKGMVSAEYRKDSHLVAEDEPGLLGEGETFHRGGIFRHGWSVYVSGLPSQWDLAIAEAIAGRLYARATTRLRELRSSGRDFVE